MRPFTVLTLVLTAAMAFMIGLIVAGSMAPAGGGCRQDFRHVTLAYVKLRSAMLRNSREKSSISDASALVVLVK